MLPHCAVHMLRTFSLHFLRAPLNGCRFWDGPIVFQRLARFTTSKPPTSILWYATFDIPTFWCDMRFEELWVTWPSISLSHKSDPRFVRNWESCEARFPWKSIRNQGAVGRITCKFTIISERKTRTTWENTRKVNPTNAAGFLRGALSSEKNKECGRDRPHHIVLQPPWTQDTLSLKKHMESGRVSATHVLVEKRYGIRENTRNLGGSVPRAVSLKTQGIGGVGHPWHINLQSKWSRGAIYTVYTTISRGSLADWGGGVY